MLYRVGRGKEGGVFEGFSSWAGSFLTQGNTWVQEPPWALTASAGSSCSPGAGSAGNLPLSPAPNQRL